VTAGAAPLRVLFVCTANTCRSPFMELLARHRAGDALAVSSAGTHGLTDQPMTEEMADRLRERGISPDGFRSRPLTGALVEEADLVLTAEAAHRAFALAEWPAASGRILTLGQLAAAVRAGDPGLAGPGVLAHLGDHHSPADPALDVADPYLRGPDEAARCATGIEDLLRVVVPALSATRMIAP
jgi:sulfate adenylyltransferase